MNDARTNTDTNCTNPGIIQECLILVVDCVLPCGKLYNLTIMLILCHVFVHFI